MAQNLENWDIKFLPGVGPQRASVLDKEAGIRSVLDLLYYYPYKYVDRSRLFYIHELEDNMPYVQVRGEILSFETFGEGRQKRLVAHFSDGTGVKIRNPELQVPCSVYRFWQAYAVWLAHKPYSPRYRRGFEDFALDDGIAAFLSHNREDETRGAELARHGTPHGKDD